MTERRPKRDRPGKRWQWRPAAGGLWAWCASAGYGDFGYMEATTNARGEDVVPHPWTKECQAYADERAERHCRDYSRRLDPDDRS